MIRQPIAPRNGQAPTQTSRQLQKAHRQIYEVMPEVRRRVIQRFEQVQHYTTTGNRDDAQRTYHYLIDEALLASISDYIMQMIDDLVLRGDNGGPIIVGAAQQAYQTGVAYQIANFQAQSDVFRRTLEETLLSAPYRTRIGLVRARVFEEMQGFTAETRKELQRILADGMARGLSPRDIVGQIEARTGVDERRAERIARTEINNAHRRALLDQDEQANDEGIRTRLLWFSALSSTTRRWHGSRHGHTFTRQEVSDFYSRDANGINCLCSVRSILVDENGNPLSEVLPDRLRLQGAKFFKEAA
ncbi:phage minor head protein [Vreelandella populi]|nr:phage minor head protein [Halomonas populi]